MDDPGLGEAEHLEALRGLTRLNRVSGAAEVLWPQVRKVAERHGGGVRVLDVATGSGDVPLSLGKRAKRAGLKLALGACDISERALEVTRARALAGGQVVELIRADATAEALPSGYDVVTCSLFLHHLDEAGAERVLRNMGRAAGRMVLVSDLRRSRRGLGLAWAASRVLSRSRVVHVDAVRSVRGAFSVEEMQGLAMGAGLAGASVTRVWPQRMLLCWERA